MDQDRPQQVQAGAIKKSSYVEREVPTSEVNAKSDKDVIEVIFMNLKGGSAANTDGPTDDEDSDGRSHYSAHGNNSSNTGQSSNFSQTYRERRREAHTQVFTDSYNYHGIITLFIHNKHSVSF